MDSSRKRTFSNAMELSPPAPAPAAADPTTNFGGNSAINTTTTTITTNAAATNIQNRYWSNTEDEGYSMPEKRHFAHTLSNKLKCEGSFDLLADEATCFVCSKLINDEFVYKTAPNLKLHRSCLRCEECGRLLDEDYSCFVQSSKIYCKSDYTRLFSGKCLKCKQTFVSDDSIVRVNSRACHSECFSCDLCTESIGFGDEFVWTGERLLCKKDWQSQEVELEQRKQTSIKSETKSTTVESEPKTDNESNQQNQNPPKKTKTTRVRTVLNEKQLQTLRTCYNNNPRPDALMKEQLCEMTGLTPRVIRVWFQNKRCKDKKRSLMIKQLQEQERLREMGRSALPMIAGSPITNELGGGHIGPVEISSFHHHHQRHHHQHWRTIPSQHQPNTAYAHPSAIPQEMALNPHQRQYEPTHYYAATAATNANSAQQQPSQNQQQQPTANNNLIHQLDQQPQQQHPVYGIYPNEDCCYDDLNPDL